MPNWKSMDDTLDDWWLKSYTIWNVVNIDPQHNNMTIPGVLVGLEPRLNFQKLYSSWLGHMPFSRQLHQVTDQSAWLSPKKTHLTRWFLKIHPAEIPDVSNSTWPLSVIWLPITLQWMEMESNEQIWFKSSRTMPRSKECFKAIWCKNILIHGFCQSLKSGLGNQWLLFVCSIYIYISLRYIYTIKSFRLWEFILIDLWTVRWCPGFSRLASAHHLHINCNLHTKSLVHSGRLTSSLRKMHRTDIPLLEETL